MMLTAAQQVRDGLAELIRLVNCGGAATMDARRVLLESKAFAAQVAVLQADAAALVAAGERHGDGGAGVLAQTAGLSRRDAAGQVKTVEKLQSMPDVRDAVTDGEISLANAKTLAQASEKISAAQVERDGDLLGKAASLSPEQFAREAGRWVVQRQDDGGEGEYRRKRARRRLSIWNGDDGMVHLRGELDPVVGAKMRKRFLEEAERLRRRDINSPGGEQRSLPQRLVDALETLTAPSGSADGHRSRPSADITIVQHLSPEGDKAFAEIAGGGVIPQIVLEEQFCNAKIVGVVFSSKGAASLAGTRAAAAHQSADGRADSPLRRLRRLRRAPRHVPGPSHPAQVSGRPHRHRQLDAAVLGMPRQGPYPRLAGGARRRPAHHRTPRAHPLRPGPSARSAADPRTSLHPRGPDGSSVRRQEPAKQEPARMETEPLFAVG